MSFCLSHTLHKTVLKSSQVKFLVSWNLCFIVAKKSKFRKRLSLTNTIQFSQNGLYLHSGLILICSNNNVLINSDYNQAFNCSSCQISLSASLYTFLASRLLDRDTGIVRKGCLFFKHQQFLWEGWQNIFTAGQKALQWPEPLFIQRDCGQRWEQRSDEWVLWDFTLVYSCFNAYWLQEVALFLHPEAYPSIGWQ